MQVSQIFTCECNGREYTSKPKLNQHKKTKGHIHWETINELKSLKIEMTKRDNTIMCLKNDKESLQQLNIILMGKIKEYGI